METRASLPAYAGVLALPACLAAARAAAPAQEAAPAGTRPALVRVPAGARDTDCWGRRLR